MIPTLFYPFEGSATGRDRDGNVTPIVGGTPAFTTGKVDGTQAIQLVSSATSYVRIDGSTAKYIDHAEGAIAVRMRPNIDEPTALRYLFFIGSTSSGAFLMASQDTSGFLRFWTRTDGSITASTPNSVVPLDSGSYVDYIFEWDASEIAIFGTGGELASSGRTGSPSSTWSTDRLMIGATGNTIDADIDSVLIYDRRPSQDQRDTLFAADVWSWSILASPAPPPSRVLNRAAKLAALHAGGWL